MILSALGLTAHGQAPENLKTIENQYLAAFELQVEQGHLARVAELDGKYLGALDKAFQAATQGDRLKEALAMRDEMERVKAKLPLPETDEGMDKALTKFRSTYREQLAKLMAERAKAAAPIVRRFEDALVAHQSALTQAGKVDEAEAVLAYREKGVAAALLGKGNDLAAAHPQRRPGSPAAAAPASATKDRPFENSLGMSFVPVPGTGVLFCMHETRWRDYAEYARANPGIAEMWKNQTFEGVAPADRNEDHPVVLVNWEESAAFCKWLSEKEKKPYRLPTDREWSIAAGLGRKEKWQKGDTPESVEKDRKEFPWGTAWPPPKGAGNYGDQSAKSKGVKLERYIDDYDDGFPTTAPVMSFAPNAYGLYDLGGNVWEWVEDWMNATKERRAWRGGSWVDTVREHYMLSSFRNSYPPTARIHFAGFRVVLELPEAP